MRTSAAPRGAVLAALLALLAAGAWRAPAGEPPLPPGMGGAGEAGGGQGGVPPPLPPGLEPGGDEPELPPGLGEEGPEGPAAKRPARRLPFDLRGFLEARAGVRTREDDQKDATVGEVRLQLDAERQLGRVAARITADIYWDGVAEDHEEVRLEPGAGFVDLRQASAAFSPLSFADVKVGRQILTWGTGDMLFINDLFPKDWNSFLIGRDEEYLKAPSDALKVSLHSDWVSLDAVYTPRFDADRFIDGRRVSYWSPVSGERVGRSRPLDARVPDEWFEDDEAALRLHRNLGGYELAAYWYRGFWKSPGGFDPVEGQATFPGLEVWGLSARGRLGPGIASCEFGWYRSLDDPDGDDPLVGNGQLRFLAGYNQELARDFSAGLQWYVEHMLDHDGYRGSLPPGAASADEGRHVLTLRLTRMLLKQNLQLSLFGYWSPTDRDAYLRPEVRYRIDDHWSVEAGANLFVGEEPHTFFGQFEDNTNLYAALRWSF